MGEQEEKICACGFCNLVVKPGNTYALGHGTRGKKITGRAKRKKLSPPQLCLCGCGEMTTAGHKWKRGHHPSWNLGTKKPLSEPQLCACGCGKMTSPGCIWISGHNPPGNKGKTGTQQSWNKGLTKETDERLAKGSENMKGPRPNMTGENSWMHNHKGELSPLYGQEAWNKGLNKTNNSSMKQNSDSHLGKTPWNKGVTGYTTKPCSPEQKALLSILNSGINSGMYGRYGELNPNWRGGITDDPYPREWTDKLKKKVKQRDGFTCQICNKSIKDLKDPLSVHHVDYDKENCDPMNLITLCRPCHGITNYNRKRWQEELSNKLSEFVYVVKPNLKKENNNGTADYE